MKSNLQLAKAVALILAMIAIAGVVAYGAFFRDNGDGQKEAVA